MKKTSVRDLHLKTSDIIKQVAAGETFVIEKQGRQVAELRPVSRQLPTARMPDREDFLMKLPRVKKDSGRILEEDRI